MKKLTKISKSPKYPIAVEIPSRSGMEDKIRRESIPATIQKSPMNMRYPSHRGGAATSLTFSPDMFRRRAWSI
jgi:hypothetical protein